MPCFLFRAITRCTFRRRRRRQTDDHRTARDRALAFNKTAVFTVAEFLFEMLAPPLGRLAQRCACDCTNSVHTHAWALAQPRRHAADDRPLNRRRVVLVAAVSETRSVCFRVLLFMRRRSTLSWEDTTKKHVQPNCRFCRCTHARSNRGGDGANGVLINWSPVPGPELALVHSWRGLVRQMRVFETRSRLSATDRRVNIYVYH